VIRYFFILCSSVLLMWSIGFGVLAVEDTPKYQVVEPLIADGGEMGWTKMSITCGLEIDTIEVATECLKEKIWKNFYELAAIKAEMTEEYIEIGGMQISQEATQNANVKVFVFKQHAIDASGNMYLYAQPG
jgi:hypothetical protein